MSTCGQRADFDGDPSQADPSHRDVHAAGVWTESSVLARSQRADFNMQCYPTCCHSPSVKAFPPGYSSSTRLKQPRQGGPTEGDVEATS